MKFVHIADMHFDSAFCALAGNEKFAVERRLEQRKAMKEVVEYIKQNNIPYFFIAGDLYEQEYIRKSKNKSDNDQRVSGLYIKWINQLKIFCRL